LVGAVGGSVIFSLNFTVKQVDSIAWLFNETTLVTVQPATGDEQPTFIAAHKRNKPRVHFQDGGYSLTFSQLKKTDSGIYSVIIHSSDSQSLFPVKYRLNVYEHLSKPKVTMGLQSNKNGTCITNLTCSMEEGGEDVTYSWKALDQAANESHDGSILPISWTLGGNDVTFICMARNPISSNSSSPIFARKLCGGGSLAIAECMVSLWLKPLCPCCPFLGKPLAWVGIGTFVNPAQCVLGPTPAHTIYTMLSQGNERLDTPLHTIRHESTSTSDTSSESSITTKENEERTKIHLAVGGSDKITRKHTGCDLASEGQADYNATTAYNTVLKSVAKQDVEYVQVFSDKQRKTPVPQEESSATIYCTIQKPQKV
ncbi:SLAM family member 7, partial [Heterocephalus glaber]